MAFVSMSKRETLVPDKYTVLPEEDAIGPGTYDVDDFAQKSKKRLSAMMKDKPAFNSQ